MRCPQLVVKRMSNDFYFNVLKSVHEVAPTFDEIVGSMALRSRTRLPSRQKVRLARGSNRPGSVQRHLTSGPIFSMTSNCTIPPSTSSSSPTLTSGSQMHTLANVFFFFFWENKTKQHHQSNEGMQATFSKAIIVHMNGVVWKRWIKSPDTECPDLPILQKPQKDQTKGYLFTWKYKELNTKIRQQSKSSWLKFDPSSHRSHY